MNRRSFLAGIGAAVTAIAVTTRLGQTNLKLSPPDGVAFNAAMHPELPSHLATNTEWFLSEESLETIFIDIKRHVDASGIPIRITPTHAIFPARRVS